MIKILTSFLFCSLCFSSNITEQYLKTKKEASSIKPSLIKKKVDGATVVLLAGILSETTIDGSSQRINVASILGDYFKDYIDWLNKVGVKNQRIIVESEDSVDNNSKYIERELKKVKGKLIVISHSKGGLEFLNVLLSNDDIKKRTKLWITMQSPFYGAKIADILAITPLIRSGTRWIFEFLGGSLEGMSSIGIGPRKKFHQDKQKKIDTVFENLNFVQYSSYIENRFGPETPLEVTRDLISLSVGRNDGLVEVSSTHLPYGKFIVESGIDHLTTVVDFKRLNLIPALTNKYKNWSFSRVDHLKTLLYLSL